MHASTTTFGPTELNSGRIPGLLEGQTSENVLFNLIHTLLVAAQSGRAHYSN